MGGGGGRLGEGDTLHHCTQHTLDVRSDACGGCSGGGDLTTTATITATIANANCCTYNSTPAACATAAAACTAAAAAGTGAVGCRCAWSSRGALLAVPRNSRSGLQSSAGAAAAAKSGGGGRALLDVAQHC